MRTHVLLTGLLCTGLAGCLMPAATDGELAATGDGDVGSQFLAALDPANELYDANLHGGPFPYYATEYLEEGETIPEGYAIEEAWAARSLARSPDGRELYLLHHGTPSTRYVVLGDLPEGARAHLILDTEDYEGVAVAVVDEREVTARMLSWSSHVEPLPLPIAAGPDGSIGAPGLDETVALRWLRTCPGLLEECALYGPAEEVAAAVDPIAPEGDWFLHARDATLAAPEGARFEEVARYDGDGGGRLIVTRAPLGIELDGIGQELYRAFFELGGRRVHAFDFISHEDHEWAIARVARDGDRLIASYWRPEDITASFSEHDARTGERIGEPLTLEAEMYFEPECTAGIYTTRPMPVRTPDGLLSFALWWGERQVLLFDGRSSYGSRADVDLVVDEEDYWFDTQADDVPAVLHLAP